MLAIFAGTVGMVAFVFGVAPIELTVNGVPASRLSPDVAARAADFLHTGRMFSLLLAVAAIAVAATIAVEIRAFKKQ